MSQSSNHATTHKKGGVSGRSHASRLVSPAPNMSSCVLHLGVLEPISHGATDALTLAISVDSLLLQLRLVSLPLRSFTPDDRSSSAATLHLIFADPGLFSCYSKLWASPSTFLLPVIRRATQPAGKCEAV